MNEVIKSICSRRSIKSFLNIKIKDEDLNLILEAGKHAPSGHNMQSAIMVVFKNHETISKLSAINASVINLPFDPFYGAPIVVAVLAKQSVPTYVFDGSVVLENMLLAAHSLEIGSCWVHRAKETFESIAGREILREMNVPDEYVGIGFCLLGYAKNKKPEQPTLKDNYVYFEK